MSLTLWQGNTIQPCLDFPPIVHFDSPKLKSWIVMTEEILANTLQLNLPRIVHIQLADVPGRHQPGSGETNFAFIFSVLERAIYAGWIGCEYHPGARTGDSFA